MKSHLSQSSTIPAWPAFSGYCPSAWALHGASIIHSLDLESRHIILANAGLSVCVSGSVCLRDLVLQADAECEGIRCTFPDVGLSIIVAALMIPLMGFVSLGARQLLYNESVTSGGDGAVRGRKLRRAGSQFVFIGIAIPIMEEVFIGACVSLGLLGGMEIRLPLS